MSERARMLAEMELPVWVLREPAASAAPKSEPVQSPQLVGEPELIADGMDAASELTRLPEASAVSDMAWGELQEVVSKCEVCELHETRTQTVFGVGNQKADWLIIGEAPGADEDRQGEPFIGRAGQLLNQMLRAVGLPRDQVFIANILKCRPPGNRDPHANEVASCAAYLQRQIALVRPKVIVAVGRVAAQNLLELDGPLGRLRQQSHSYRDTSIPVVVTYHPAYLLRSPIEKRKAWADLCHARSLVANGG